MNPLEYICTHFPELLLQFLGVRDMATLRVLNSPTRAHISKQWTQTIFTLNVSPNYVASKGHVYVMRMLINGGIRPTAYGADLAAKNGHVGMVRELHTQGILSRAENGGANWAAMNGHIEVVNELRAQGINPTRRGVDWAAWNGQMVMVRELRIHGIHATAHGADLAAGDGYLEMVRELRTHGIHATSHGADMAAGGGHLEMVRDLRTHGIHATPYGASEANLNGHVEVERDLVNWGVLSDLRYWGNHNIF